MKLIPKLKSKSPDPHEHFNTPYRKYDWSGAVTLCSTTSLITRLFYLNCQQLWRFTKMVEWSSNVAVYDRSPYGGQITEDTVVRKNKVGSLEFTDFGAGPSDLADVFWFAEYPLSLGGVRTVSDHNDFSASRLYERAFLGWDSDIEHMFGRDEQKLIDDEIDKLPPRHYPE